MWIKEWEWPGFQGNSSGSWEVFSSWGKGNRRAVFPCSVSCSSIMNVYTVIDRFVEIAAGVKNVRRPVEFSTIHQRNNFPPNIRVTRVGHWWRTTVHQLKSNFTEKDSERYMFGLRVLGVFGSNAVSLDILLLFLPEMATVDHHYPCSTVLEVTRIQWPQHKMFLFIYFGALQPGVVFRLCYFQISFVKELLSPSFCQWSVSMCVMYSK